MGRDAGRIATGVATGGLSEAGNIAGEAIDGISGIGKPENVARREDFQVPYADDLRSRLFAIIDNYVRGQGMDRFMTPESRPYEYRDADQRGAWREQSGGNRPSLSNGLFFDPQKPRPLSEIVGENVRQNPMPASIDQVRELPEETKKYQRDAMGAKLAAEQAGITAGQPMTAPREFQMQDDGRRQEEVERLKNFINEQRTGKMRARSSYGN